MNSITPFETRFETPTINQSKFYVFHDVTMEKKNTAIHWHNEIEFLCCMGNEVGVYYDSDIIKMKKGDTIIVNSNSIHYVAPEDDMRCFCLIVSRNFFRENEIDISALEFDRKIFDAKAFSLMEDVYEAIVNAQGEFEMAKKRQAVLTYILYMCQKYSHKRNNSYIRESKAHLAVREAIEYIDKNFSKKITLESIANHFNYSKYHFARLFKENTGFTLVEHLNKKRAEHANELLKDTQNKKTLNQVCDECGFASYAYFSKCFKAIYGVLPSDYRKNMKTNFKG